MDFIADQNIQRFRRMLDCEADPRKRSVIVTLLREEQSKLFRDPACGDSGNLTYK